jgi:hypothetical protein
MSALLLTGLFETVTLSAIYLLLDVIDG